MWILLNNSFLSIVEDKENPKILLVRARVKGDIERVFPGTLVTVGAGSDYEYRAFISRANVKSTMLKQIDKINYTNFKSSVKEFWRHEVYLDVWHTLRYFFKGR